MQPKIDGVRGLTVTGKLTGRSLKSHANVYTTEFYSVPEYAGLDGELAAAQECDADLCRKTTSALNTIEGEPFTFFWAFDLLVPNTMHLPYRDRLDALYNHIASQHSRGLAMNAVAIPYVWIGNEADMLEQDAEWLEMGYEGSIIRDPNGMHKQGRSTVREGGLLRIKRFIEEDAIVLRVVEGVLNENEAQTNELGQTFRSTHQANMIPNGKLGAMICKDVKTGKEITVGAGRMPHGDRELYFKHPEIIIGETIKYKHFPKGVKVKPRFPTFQSLRSDSDKVK
jgi:DNA ligase-1